MLPTSGLAGIATASAASGFNPVVTGVLALGSIISGLLASQDSPQEENIQQLVDMLYDNMDWLKQTSFSKSELMNAILPAVQKSYRGSADVVAGKVGAAAGETSTAPKGQAFMDYYIQNLGGVIAEGENRAAGATKEFASLWASIDANAKNTFLSALQVGGQLNEGLPSQTPGQKAVAGGLQGFDIMSDVYGNIKMADALSEKGKFAEDISQILTNSYKKMGSGAFGQTFNSNRLWAKK